MAGGGAEAWRQVAEVASPLDSLLAVERAGGIGHEAVRTAVGGEPALAPLRLIAQDIEQVKRVFEP